VQFVKYQQNPVKTWEQMARITHSASCKHTARMQWCSSANLPNSA